jgi:glycosyltransferase involved in cell wall biosynthesis
MGTGIHPIAGRAPEVTVILPTRNRRDLLREAIESLWRQTAPADSYEILVVDNVSDDGTEEMMAELQAKSPVTLRYQRNSRNLGCFGSINLAVELARGEVIASTDSDCWADPNWIERGMEPFRGNPRMAFVAGHIADKPGQPVTLFSLRNGAPKEENLFYPSGNCFYRRSIYLELGGCLENLSFGDVGNSPIGCGDSDLAWRMRKAGYEYAYRGDAVVFHEVFRVSPWKWLKAHGRVFVMPELTRRHPELRKLLLGYLFLSSENIYFYLAILGGVAGIWLGPLALLAAVPHVGKAALLGGARRALLNLPKSVARVALVSARQGVICGSLIYGSLRARNPVL